MTISFELVDANNAVHVFMYNDMCDKFTNDYNASGDIANPVRPSLSKNHQTIYFVKVNNQYAGLNILQRVYDTNTKTCVAYVSDVIYIDSKFRNNNVATEVRKEMRLFKRTTENVDVIGSKVSIQRVKRKMKYFVNQQFKYMYNVCDAFDPVNNVFDCQTEDDGAIVLLTYDKLPANYVCMYPFKVRMSLSTDSVDKYRKFYKKFVMKHCHKFQNIQSKEFENYVEQVYVK